MPRVGILLAFLLSGCLTLNKGLHQDPPHPNVVHRSANISFEFEAIYSNGTRVIFSPNDVEAQKSKLLSVLKEFGVHETKVPSDLQIKAIFRIKDAECQTVFIDSSCMLSQWVAPLSLLLLPVAVGTEHEVTLRVSETGKPTTESVRSNKIITHMHLILLPLLPLEIYHLIDADFLKSLYRSMFRESLIAQIEPDLSR